MVQRNIKRKHLFLKQLKSMKIPKLSCQAITCILLEVKSEASYLLNQNHSHDF